MFTTRKLKPEDTVCARLFNSSTAQFDYWLKGMAMHMESLPQPYTMRFHPLNADIHPATDLSRLQDLCNQVAQEGFALYQWQNDSELSEVVEIAEHVRYLLCALGLHSTDEGVIRDVADLALLQDRSGTPQARFPPYQSAAMGWHTDGYYNDAASTVRSFTLHCVEQADKGGALTLMDDRWLVYALLKDDPKLVELLSHPQAMTLPSNRDQEGHNRPDRTVPIIFAHTDGTIGMRFTTRTRNITWRCENTHAAAQYAAELIARETQWHRKIRLARGQGIITRNILHKRDQFKDTNDGAKRQMLRGRFAQLPTITTAAHKSQ